MGTSLEDRGRKVGVREPDKGKQRKETPEVDSGYQELSLPKYESYLVQKGDTVSHLAQRFKRDARKTHGVQLETDELIDNAKEELGHRASIRAGRRIDLNDLFLDDNAPKVARKNPSVGRGKGSVEQEQQSGKDSRESKGENRQVGRSSDNIAPGMEHLSHYTVTREDAAKSKDTWNKIAKKYAKTFASNFGGVELEESFLADIGKMAHGSKLKPGAKIDLNKTFQYKELLENMPVPKSLEKLGKYEIGRRNNTWEKVVDHYADTLDRKADIDLTRKEKAALVKKVSATSRLERGDHLDLNQMLGTTDIIKAKAMDHTPPPKLPTGVVAGSRAIQAVSQYAPLIKRYAEKNGISPELMASMMIAESGGNPFALSPRDAAGLMQMIPSTFESFKDPDVRSKSRFDPEASIAASARYLKYLHNMFDGNRNLVIAGYNAGEGAVQKFGNQVPPYAETKNYLATVLTNIPVVEGLFSR